MFMMLIVTVFVHALTSRLMGKVTKYPLRLLLVRVLEALGKIGVIPFVLIYFLCTFTDYGTEVSRAMIIVLICIGVCVLGFREYSGLKADIKVIMTMLRSKIDKMEQIDHIDTSVTTPVTGTGTVTVSHRVTSIELFIFNLYTFGIYSNSAVHYHTSKHNYSGNGNGNGNDEVFNTVHSSVHSSINISDMNIDNSSVNVSTNKRNIQDVMLEQHRSEFHEL